MQGYVLNPIIGNDYGISCNDAVPEKHIMVPEGKPFLSKSDTGEKQYQHHHR
jgi:hypothetical protein